MTFLTSGAYIIFIISLVYFFLEVQQMCQRPTRYFSEVENYIQLPTFPLCMIFVFPAGHECWYLSAVRWQLGAIAVFLAWFNLVFLLKYIPQFAVPAIQLINIYTKFAKIIYLPILLIITFALPFYMLLVQSVDATVVSY